MRLPSIIRRHKQFFTFILLTAIYFVVFLSVCDLLLRMFYELRGPFGGDSMIYWAVGRGIVNGLVPYQDLFETKPPGIFLLSALSFSLFGSPVLGHVIEGLSIPVYPVVLGWLAWSTIARRKCTYEWKVTCMAVAVLGGILLGLYTMDHSGEFQVESFGALAAILYLWVIARDAPLSPLHMALAATFLLLGIGMKEPFLLTIAGGAMILWADRPVRLIRVFVIPLIIAAAAGIVIMVGLGYLRPYVTIYLSEIMYTMPRNFLWNNVLSWSVLFRDLQNYVWPMGYLMAALLVDALWRPILSEQFFQRLIVRTVFIVAAVCLAVTAVAMKGNFYAHHFVFAVPVSMALLMVFVRGFGDPSDTRHSTYRRVWTAVVGFLIVVTTLRIPSPDYEQRLRLHYFVTERVQHVAQQIDAILTACGQERYLFIGMNGPQPYGYTTHSPYGPLFFQFSNFLAPSETFFREGMKESLSKTSLIVQERTDVLGDLESSSIQYMGENFSTDPWPCAMNVWTQDAPGYEFFFRKAVE